MYQHYVVTIGWLLCMWYHSNYMDIFLCIWVLCQHVASICGGHRGVSRVLDRCYLLFAFWESNLGPLKAQVSVTNNHWNRIFSSPFPSMLFRAFYYFYLFLYLIFETYLEYLWVPSQVLDILYEISGLFFIFHLAICRIWKFYINIFSVIF